MHINRTLVLDLWGSLLQVILPFIRVLNCLQVTSPNNKGWQFYMGCTNNKARSRLFEVDMEGSRLYMGVCLSGHCELDTKWILMHG